MRTKSSRSESSGSSSLSQNQSSPLRRREFEAKKREASSARVIRVDHSQLGARTSGKRTPRQAQSNSRQAQSASRQDASRKRSVINAQNRRISGERNVSQRQTSSVKQSSVAQRRPKSIRNTPAKAPGFGSKLGDKFIALLAFGYKHRRILGLLLVVVLLLATTLFVVKYLRSSVNAVNSAATQPSPTAEFEPIACTADSVQLRLSNTSQYAGQPVNFLIHYTYSGTGTPCYLSANKDDLQVVVSTGDVEVWDSKQCGVGVDNLQLLFAPDVSYKKTYAWDGNNVNSSCKVTGAAKPGTYRAKVTGVAGLTDEITFVLEAAPAPQPTTENDE
ncbi:MAG: hypothetical protein SPG61_04970 [Arcanobacterium sp.]|nr:hypothetical protein [Arcanobacterium sp.]